MNAMRTLHQILLQPTDVLFFRDGRPMTGSLAGHTAAWPLPDVTNHALHAALHRAGLSGVHTHRRGRSGRYTDQRDRKFGCLLTAGPFPVAAAADPGCPLPEPCWFFPRPRDTLEPGSVALCLHPVPGDWRQTSSLPKPLRYAVANSRPPAKESGAEPWISQRAFERYLRDPAGQPESSNQSDPPEFLKDDDLADLEQTIGIRIDPESLTTGQGDAEGQIYSAYYLRLRDRFRLGLFAEAMDKVDGDPARRCDLIRLLFNDEPRSILVGGQQRLCTAQRADAPEPLPLPQGLRNESEFKQLPNGTYAVKWVLLTPAIWPEIRSGETRDAARPRIQAHPGGWLPNWVHPETGDVLLKAGDTDRKPGETRVAWRARVRALPPVKARLVAAIVPKPLAVTGWSLGWPEDAVEGTETPDGNAGTGGAKSTHLAVPAGAVYYFEADSPGDAARLAAALNWHGSTPGHVIVNRRSTLLGEKGYGLGVCGTWQFYDGSDPSAGSVSTDRSKETQTH